MEIKDLEIGKWYMIENYGYSFGLRGKLVEIVRGKVVLKFYWGYPWRTRQAICLSKLIEECKKPSLFSNY